jgi:Calcineurin-like phosphoesterase superfamily domain
VAWTLEHTDERSKRFTRELPFDLRFELAGKRVRLVHGSPRKVNEYLLEDRAASTFERIAQLADCDVLLFGHTHKPWVREYGGVLRQLRLGREAERRRPPWKLHRRDGERRRRVGVDRASRVRRERRHSRDPERRAATRTRGAARAGGVARGAGCSSTGWRSMEGLRGRSASPDFGYNRCRAAREGTAAG